MIRGRFGNTSERPYIEAHLYIPSLNVSGMVSWLADTGADTTALMPTDTMRLGISYARLKTRQQTYGVGGVSRDYAVPAAIIVTEPDVALYAYEISLTVVEPKPELDKLPSLLGRDVMKNWRITFDFTTNDLIADVLRWDYRTDLKPA